MLTLTLSCGLRVAILGGRSVGETTIVLEGDRWTSHISTGIR